MQYALLPGFLVEVDASSAGVNGRAWFVETNVASSANSK